MMNEVSSSKKVRLAVDLRLVVLLLVAVIIVMLFIWKPWSSGPAANARSIKVTGETTIQAEPDQFVFYPSYDFSNSDKNTALAEMNKKSDELIGKLKTLGVSDKQIKSSANGSGRLYYAPRGDNTYNLQLTITVDSRDLAQKVQDYLVTTGPGGMITPSATFSEAKRKSLESEARNKATQDARAKADQTAKNLGAHLGKVKSVDEGSGFGGITPLYDKVSEGANLDTSRLSVQPGQNDFNYSVTVEFYLK